MHQYITSPHSQNNDNNVVTIFSTKKKINRKMNRDIEFNVLTSCLIICLFELADLPVVNCATNTHLCNANAVCKNIEGSHICICNSGYIGNGKICAGNEDYKFKILFPSLGYKPMLL